MTSTQWIDPSGFPQAFVYKGQAPLWRIGSWNGHGWSGVPAIAGLTAQLMFNVSFVNNEDELSVMDVMTDDSIFSRMVINESGIVERTYMNVNQDLYVRVDSIELAKQAKKSLSNKGKLAISLTSIVVFILVISIILVYKDEEKR
ncbi:hypothetical protein M0R45_010519 [Rubus argutus]|uniref:S-locus glycoprotein domain-containing protein n=1 Tax=Rubus argutus TaxID=59490 RepID=A0AAW1Y779_RUBAR